MVHWFAAHLTCRMVQPEFLQSRFAWPPQIPPMLELLLWQQPKICCAWPASTAVPQARSPKWITTYRRKFDVKTAKVVIERRPRVSWCKAHVRGHLYEWTCSLWTIRDENRSPIREHHSVSDFRVVVAGIPPNQTLPGLTVIVHVSIEVTTCPLPKAEGGFPLISWRESQSTGAKAGGNK